MLNPLDHIFKIQLFTTLMMAGVLWMVQLVHYPLFRGLDPLQFKDWHQFHSSMISLIVVPLMVLELLSGAALVFVGAPELPERWKAAVLMALTLLIWASTFFLSVPLHNRLASGFDRAVIDQLVLTNWPRTFAASAKALLLYFWFKLSI